MVETLSVTLVSAPLRVPTLTVPTDPFVPAILIEGAMTVPSDPMFRVPPPTPRLGSPSPPTKIVPG